jgi:hypothetical protein
MRLVGLLLFALAFSALTACGDDDYNSDSGASEMSASVFDFGTDLPTD